MKNKETHKIDISLYHRTYYNGLLEEQTNIPINNLDIDLTLVEFVKFNFTKYPFPILSIFYEGKEITKFEAIIVDGQLDCNVDIYTLKIKDILDELEYGPLIIYVDQDRSSGGTYDSYFSVIEIINLVMFVTPLMKYFYKRKIRPYRLKEMTLRKKEWNVEEYQKRFLMDTLKEADWSLKTLGYKREGMTMIYKKKEKDKNNDMYEEEEDSVG